MKPILYEDASGVYDEDDIAKIISTAIKFTTENKQLEEDKRLLIATLKEFIDAEWMVSTDWCDSSTREDLIEKAETELNKHL